ncbi:hypothetical protein GCM10027614_34390 [Micromonospora vulcania]
MVAKIHSARSAVTGATTNAVSFERIGQSRVLITPRPYRGGRRAPAPPGDASAGSARRERRAPARAPWAGYVIVGRCTTARRAEIDAPECPSTWYDEHPVDGLSLDWIKFSARADTHRTRLGEESAPDRDW